MRSLSLGIVEKNAERVTVARADAADAMAELDTIHPTRPPHRALMHREQHAVESMEKLGISDELR